MMTSLGVEAGEKVYMIASDRVIAVFEMCIYGKLRWETAILRADNTRARVHADVHGVTRTCEQLA